MNTSWSRIMAELTGRRLRVLDDIARGAAIAEHDPNVENALGWLAYHHLVWRNASGQLQAREPSEAQTLWRQGPATNAAQIFGPVNTTRDAGAGNPPAPAATPAPAMPLRPAQGGPRVHSHQAQIFADV